MLDRLMGYYAAYRFKDTDEQYDSSMAIESRKVTNEGGDVLTVLFPPWRGAEGIYDTLRKRLEKSGSAVLGYDFHRQILEPNTKRVVASFEVIRDRVVDDVTQLSRAHNYEKVHLIASSLGNVSMSLVATRLDRFDSATMVVPGSSLARCTWEGSRTQSIREVLEAQGLDEDSLDRLWLSVAPQHASRAFKGKSVHIHTSTSDEIIPARYQQEMVDALSGAGANVTVNSSSIGHIASILNYCLRGPLPTE